MHVQPPQDWTYIRSGEALGPLQRRHHCRKQCRRGRFQSFGLKYFQCGSQNGAQGLGGRLRGVLVLFQQLCGQARRHFGRSLRREYYYAVCKALGGICSVEPKRSRHESRAFPRAYTFVGLLCSVYNAARPSGLRTAWQPCFWGGGGTPGYPMSLISLQELPGNVGQT